MPRLASPAVRRSSRRRWVAVLALVIVFCGHVGSVAVLAQVAGDPPPVTGGLRTDLGACLNRSNATAGDGTVFAPDAAPAVGTILSPLWYIRNAAVCAAAFAGDVLLPDYGAPIFIGLAIVLVVWTGVQIMFSGRFDVGEMISLVLFIGFLSMILMSYTTAGGAIWGNEPAPIVLMSLGEGIATDLVDGVWESAQVVVNSVIQTFQDRANRQALYDAAFEANARAQIDDTDVSLFGVGRTGMVGSSTGVFAFLLVVGILFFVLALIPLLMAYFSFLWGYFSIIIATLLGPILVPFGLLPQTDFLFWGWVRSVFAATIQVVVGGAVFAVIGQLMLVPMRRFANVFEILGSSAGMTFGDAIVRAGGLFLEFLPTFVISILVAGKVGEITSMLLTGGGVPSAGVSERMRGASQAGSAASGLMSGARGAAMVGATAATAGASVAAAGAGRVLSVVTRRN